MDPTLQIGLTVALITYLAQCRHSQVRRNQRSWHDCISLLQVNGGVLARPDNVHTLRAAFAGAPLFVQVADYAVEHCDNPDIPLLEGLRRDSFEIRLFAISGLAKQFLGRSDAQ